MTISGKAKLAGVMGWPVGHSLSPRLHGYWLAEHGIDGAYVPLNVEPEGLETALRALPVLGFAGVNVTVPHKEAATRAIDRLDEKAQRIGAVNTVTVWPDGSLRGGNTDGFGFLENLRSDAPEWSAEKGPAVVLGAGGAARAVVAALVDTGVAEVRLVNRTHRRAEALARDIGGGIGIVSWDEREAALDGAALLVNATALGMTGGEPLALGLDRLPPDAVVMDVVYAPLATTLLTDAAGRGNPTVDGLGMLLHQARPGFREWFGTEPRVTDGLRAFVLDGLAP
ncbi:MAG: shikimate dehydrogenase [Rhodospirillales bacterium]